MTRKIGRVIAEFSLFLDEFCKSVKYLRFSVIFEFTDVLFATGGISLNKLIKDDGDFSIKFFENDILFIGFIRGIGAVFDFQLKFQAIEADTGKR